MKTKNQAIGEKGELLAQEYLKKQGYEIVETNKRFSRFCEIDIIAKQKDTLVFVEVKTRSSADFGYPEEAVTETKIEHLLEASESYLLEHLDVQSWEQLEPLSRVIIELYEDFHLIWHLIVFLAMGFGVFQQGFDLLALGGVVIQ